MTSHLCVHLAAKHGHLMEPFDLYSAGNVTGVKNNCDSWLHFWALILPLNVVANGGCVHGQYSALPCEGVCQGLSRLCVLSCQSAILPAIWCAVVSPRDGNVNDVTDGAFQARVLIEAMFFSKKSEIFWMRLRAGIFDSLAVANPSGVKISSSR